MNRLRTTVTRAFVAALLLALLSYGGALQAALAATDPAVSTTGGTSDAPSAAASAAPGAAADSSSAGSAVSGDGTIGPTDTSASADPAMIALSGTTKQQIEAINQEVAAKKRKLLDLQKAQEHYRQAIASKDADSASLADDIGLIDNRIGQAQLDIELAQADISRLGLEIAAVDGHIAEQDQRIARERLLLGGLTRKLYAIEFRRSVFDVLLSQASLSAFFDALREVSDLQSGVDSTLASVQNLRRTLATDRAARQAAQADVDKRRQDLTVAKSEMEDQRAFKDTLLTQTQSSAQKYRYLLADLKTEETQADSEVTALADPLSNKLDIVDQLKGADAILSWPVDPSRGIATKFHDPDYPFRYVYEHPGLDIRAYQGTAVHAAAAGVVARAKDAGMGYSYVMIIHNGDVSTVYGHLSRVTAKEDSFVERGDVIGYSGGTPGTPGAGKLTTGPHLHFETRLHGVPVDPMRYLLTP